jgi:hypothetical protein
MRDATARTVAPQYSAKGAGNTWNRAGSVFTEASAITSNATMRLMRSRILSYGSPLNLQNMKWDRSRMVVAVHLLSRGLRPSMPCGALTKHLAQAAGFGTCLKHPKSRQPQGKTSQSQDCISFAFLFLTMCRCFSRRPSSKVAAWCKFTGKIVSWRSSSRRSPQHRLVLARDLTARIGSFTMLRLL